MIRFIELNYKPFVIIPPSHTNIKESAIIALHFIMYEQQSKDLYTLLVYESYH